MSTPVATGQEPAPGDPTGKEERWPHWAVEFNRLVAICPQFVISGNIRDNYLTQTAADGLVFQPNLVACLFERLARRDCQCLFVYDHIEGLRIHPEEARSSVAEVPVRICRENTSSREPGTRVVSIGRTQGGPVAPAEHDGETEVQLGKLLEHGSTSVAIEELPDWLRAVAGARDLRCGFVVDYASRLVSRPQDLEGRERTFFAACEKLAHETRELRAPDPGGPAPFNPIVWLINGPNDLPDWFVVRNERIRALTASLPDRDTRGVAAAKLAKGFADHDQLQPQDRAKFIGQFADLTEGETLRSMLAIDTLAREDGLPLAKVSDAVRLFKLGLPDNPWKKGDLPGKLRRAEEVIGGRVKGQQAAVRKSMEILVRSVMGLSGAQAAVRGGRPRGVLFFAGPTGVGKTELAKAITELLFGDEQSYRRFDMTEFSEEHSAARLIGSPPGYIGHDAGGELVNAVRERPFSVLLFDEIDKANRGILDKFLQILEDGRLTDGRGETVHFSEAVIIFTSNLGIYGEDETGRRVQLVGPDTPPAEVEEKVLKEIKRVFRERLERPELLNRIGDNIVVFSFIGPSAANEIFDVMLTNVVARVTQEHAIDLSIPENVSGELRDWCTADLDFGGRGIGNRIETAFINPLSVALFEHDLAGGGQQPSAGRGDQLPIKVRRIVVEDNGARRVELERE